MYKEKILKLLRISKAGFLSGEELARRCGISRTMVWKHIRSLEREGFGIEAVPSQGYRITSEPDLLRQDDIRLGLKTKVMASDIRLFDEAVSTNASAMQMAAEGAGEGTVVIAEQQTGGKGRLGRKWISPKGNLYLSVVLRPNIPLHKAPLITLMGAVAITSAIRSACEVQAGIKWPNDILVDNRKVSGLLTEMSAEQDRIRYIVLGIGVNVNMPLDELAPEVRDRATTLSAEAGQRINRTTLLRSILKDLDHWYGVFLKSEADVLAAWTSLNVTLGKRVMISGQSVSCEGIARGIDPDGRLLVEQDDRVVRTISAGDVTIVKKQGQVASSK